MPSLRRLLRVAPLAGLLPVLATADTSATSAAHADPERTLRGLARYAATVLLSETGAGRSDYDVVSAQWHDYEPAWHTGQLILALVSTAEALKDPAWLEPARRAGDWWIAQAFPAESRLRGLVNAWHGDKLGPLINWTTVSDGTPGLFALSRATGDPRYADTATRAGAWLWQHTRVPDELPDSAGLFCNIIDPSTARVWTDWNPHRQGPVRAESIAPRDPAPLFEVARPNIEGFIFADMARWTGDPVWGERFLNQAEAALARQDADGLWMDFEPNDRKSGQIHPRFNLWNAEALLEAGVMTGDRRFFEGAARTVRFHRDAATRDGTLHYHLGRNGARRTDSVTGSAVAFNGLLMLRLRQAGYTDFDDAIARTLTWIERNRFAPDHPDPNLAGALINTRQRFVDGRLRFVNRDVGTTFALRFLSAYLRDRRGESLLDRPIP